MSKQNFSLLTRSNTVKRKFNSDSSSQIILTTRARLARNLSDHKFGSISNNQEKNDILN